MIETVAQADGCGDRRVALHFTQDHGFAFLRGLRDEACQEGQGFGVAGTEGRGCYSTTSSSPPTPSVPDVPSTVPDMSTETSPM